MNETDMELQAIRQKLQTLKAETGTTAAPSPWLPPRQVPHPQSPNLAQVTAAIESLKHYQQGPTPPVTTVRPTEQAPPPPDREWIGQVLQQCDVHIARFNELGQQQGTALLRLKQYLEQAELEFERRGWDTPPALDHTIQFLLEEDGCGIPLIERTPQGQLEVNYHPVDLYQAEREAMTTAQALRQSYDDYGDELGPRVGGSWPEAGWLDANWLENVQQGLHNIWQWCQAQLGQPAPATRPVRQAPFTVMDGLIWFSGAAIVRALLNAVLHSYPALWTPMVVLLLGVGAIALHRTVVSRHRPAGLSYRLLVIVAGFIIGGQFG